MSEMMCCSVRPSTLKVVVGFVGHTTVNPMVAQSCTYYCVIEMSRHRQVTTIAAVLPSAPEGLLWTVGATFCWHSILRYNCVASRVLTSL